METTGSACSWPLPSDTALPGRQAVHVWRAALHVEPSRLQALAQTLSPDERERASGFQYRKDRERFIAARGILRSILGQYLHRAPARLQFRYGPWGKPALAGQRERGLRFNLAHSAGLALYAVAQGREVGIDLEHLRPSLAREQIAERVFSPAEAARLRRLPDPQHLEAFFTYWTLKEAFLKANGRGLTLALDGFEVSPPPHGHVARLTLPGHPREARRWSLLTLSPAPGYLAAVAIEGDNCHLQCRQWPEDRDALPPLPALRPPHC